MSELNEYVGSKERKQSVSLNHGETNHVHFSNLSAKDSIIELSESSDLNDDEKQETEEANQVENNIVAQLEARRKMSMERKEIIKKYTKASFYRNNLPFMLTVLVFCLIQLFLMMLQFIAYYSANASLKIARLAGILLNFNSALVILLVMKHISTMLRSSKIGKYLPTDHFLKFHKYVGYILLILSLIHTIGHCFNLCKYLSMPLHCQFRN